MAFQMMIPHVNNGHLTEIEMEFNRGLSQCRVKAENGFARGKGMWRRLKFLHVRNRENAVDHITASFVLHNFLILNGDVLIDVSMHCCPIQKTNTYYQNTIK